MLLLVGMRLFSSMLISLLKVNLFSEKYLDRYLNYSSKFKSFYKFQIKTIFDKSVIKGPKTGFVDFIERLIRVNTDIGVKFHCIDVQKFCMIIPSAGI